MHNSLVKTKNSYKILDLTHLSYEEYDEYTNSLYDICLEYEQEYMILYNYKKVCDQYNLVKYYIDNRINNNKILNFIEICNNLTKATKDHNELIDKYYNKEIVKDFMSDFIDNILYNIKEDINIENEKKELIPLLNEIITHKTLNKINLNEVLTTYSKLLSITDLLFIINYDINKIYVDKFWNNIEDENWVYLDEELINWFGYKEINKGKEELIEIIKSEFEIEEDYKILNNDEFLNSDYKYILNSDSKFNNNIQHIIIKPDCFKLTCLQVGTVKSKDIYRYFLEIEKIFKFYLKYTSEFNKYELEKSKLIKNRCINKNKLKYNSKLYLITSKSKAKENVFKFGSTVNEKPRKSSYNTGNVEEEKFFYVGIYECYDAISLEKRIAKLLINFKIPNESEMYQLHFTALDSIIKTACNNDCNTMNIINNFLNEEYDKYLNLEPIKF